MELFNAPIPELPDVPRALTEVLRYGMANEPRARPTAEQLHELLTGVQVAPPAPAGPPGGHYSTFVPPQRQLAGDNTPTVHHPIQPPPKRKRFFGLLRVEDS